MRAEGAVSTAALSRDHIVHIEGSGLITICGGKWTTYRHMAEDCVDQAAKMAKLPEKPCITHHLRIHGFPVSVKEVSPLAVYGEDALEIRELIRQTPALDVRLHSRLPYLKAEVVWSVRHEMARTVEDVLARRTRALFLNARAALEMAPTVADLMASELGWNELAKQRQLAYFRSIAANYVLSG